MSQMMQPLFPGHVPMTDIELFQLFNIEMPDGSDLWEVHKRWGQATYIDDFNVSATIDNGTAREARVAEYARRVAAGQSIFGDDDDDNQISLDD